MHNDHTYSQLWKQEPAHLITSLHFSFWAQANSRRQSDFITAIRLSSREEVRKVKKDRDAAHQPAAAASASLRPILEPKAPS